MFYNLKNIERIINKKMETKNRKIDINEAYKMVRTEHNMNIFMIAVSVVFIILLYVLQELYSSLVGFSSDKMKIVFMIFSVITNAIAFAFLIIRYDAFKVSSTRIKFVRSLKSSYDYLSERHRTLKAFMLSFEYYSKDLTLDIEKLFESVNPQDFVSNSDKIVERISKGDYEDETGFLQAILTNVNIIHKYYDDEFINKTFLHK